MKKMMGLVNFAELLQPVVLKPLRKAMMTSSVMLGLMDWMMQVLLLLPLEMRQHLKAMTRILVRVTMEVVKKEPHSRMRGLLILELLMKLESIQNLEQRLMMELRKPLLVEKRTRKDFPIQSSEMLVKMKILDRVMMEIVFQLQDE